MSHYRAKTALPLCALPFIFFSLSVAAAEAQVKIDTQVGFHGLFRLGYPFPLRVELANLGGVAQGILEVRVWKGGPARGVDLYPVYHRRRVLLPAQSRKSFQFTIDPDSVSRPLTLTFSGAGSRWSKEIDLRRHFSAAPLLVLVTENNFLPPLPVGPTFAGPLISLALGDLPADPRAYQGVSALVFYEQSLRDLSRRQLAALEGWLSSGGRMLILGSLHYALYQEAAMSRFLPVRVAGLKRFSALPDLDRRYGKAGAPLKDLWGQAARLVEGRAVLEDGGLPILVETDRGKGKVFYLAVDVGRPPLSRWEGLPALFRDLLASLPERSPTPQARWDDTVFSQLLATPSFISAYVPVRSFFLWTLFYLGGAGAVVWGWREHRLSRRKLALCFVLLNALASLGGYLYFSRRGNVPDGVLLTATLLDGSTGGYAEAQSNVALFSTQTRAYGVLVENGWSDLEALYPRPGTAAESAVVAEEEGSATRFSFPLSEWGYRLLRIRSQSLFPLGLELEDRGDRLTLRLNNRSAKDLTECWFVVRGQSFFLGDIARGSSLVREFAREAKAPASESQRPRLDLREIRFDNRLHEVLFRHSFFPDGQGLGRWSGDGALFFGWVREASPRVWTDDGHVLAYDYTLFRVIIPLDGGGDLDEG
ncbi:MAG: hypothetical protein HYV04_05750 [Deltaproteobacteria bacterium]|nr:hypothetical protein [Deltaproteobacteria bacterium]